MDVLPRCKGPPLSQTNLYPSTLVFFRVLYCRQEHSSGTFFHAKKKEKGSFLSSSPIHDIRLTSRGAHQTTFLFIPHLTADTELKFVISRLGCIVLITSFAALALVLISSCLGQVLSTTHFFDFSHTSNTAATLFRISFKVPN
jgi:hypothetical protein